MESNIVRLWVLWHVCNRWRLQSFTHDIELIQNGESLQNGGVSPGVVLHACNRMRLSQLKTAIFFRVIQILVQTGGRFLGVGLLALNRWRHLQLKIEIFYPWLNRNTKWTEVSQKVYTCFNEEQIRSNLCHVLLRSESLVKFYSF